MTSSCDFLSSPACVDAAKQVLTDMMPLVKAKHEIAESMVSSTKKDSVDVVTKMAKEAATVQDIYARAVEECKSNKDERSCDYAIVFKNFIGFFGPLGERLDKKKYVPIEREMVPLKSGYIVIGLDPASSGYEVIFDTGANISIISHYLAELFRDDLKSNSDPSQISNIQFAYVSNISFHMGGIVFSPTLTILSDVIDYFEGSAIGKRIIAAVGAEFLFGMPWEVDYDRSKFTMFQDVDKRISLSSDWHDLPFETFPTSVSYILGVNILINGKSLKFGIDTGATTSSILEECYFPELGTIANGAISMSLMGYEKRKTVKDLNVDIAGEQLATDLIYIMTSSSLDYKALAQNGLCGRLGNDVLANFNYIYDPYTMSFFIRRREKPAPRFKGLPFIHERMKDGSNTIIIKSIFGDQPNETNVLHEGDIILEIDGKKTSEMTNLQIFEFAYTEKDKLDFKVKRGDETLSFEVKSK